MNFNTVAVGAKAMGETPEDWPRLAMNCIALGEGAVATEPYQLVLRVRLAPGREPVQLETVMTPEEHAVVSRVVRRLVEHPATPQD